MTCLISILMSGLRCSVIFLDPCSQIIGWYFKTCDTWYLTLFIAHNYSAVLLVFIIIMKQNEMALPSLDDIFCFLLLTGSVDYW